MQVCSYMQVQVRTYMQICKYTSIQVCKYASIHILYKKLNKKKERGCPYPRQKQFTYALCRHGNNAVWFHRQNFQAFTGSSVNALQIRPLWIKLLNKWGSSSLNIKAASTYMGQTQQVRQSPHMRQHQYVRLPQFMRETHLMRQSYYHLYGRFI